jgi:Leucine-rich repeat (LRR) protein
MTLKQFFLSFIVLVIHLIDKASQTQETSLILNIDKLKEWFGVNTLINENILHLNDRNIAYIAANTFVNLTSLEFLDLNDNDLTTIEGFMFNGLNNLRHLALANNRITQIKAFTFSLLT